MSTVNWQLVVVHEVMSEDVVAALGDNAGSNDEKQ